MTGSHCDAIPLAGLYDGTLGVIGGAAAVKALRQAGFNPAKPIEVIMFTSEEPTRFGLGCIGRSAENEHPLPDSFPRCLLCTHLPNVENSVWDCIRQGSTSPPGSDRALNLAGLPRCQVAFCRDLYWGLALE